MLFFYLMYALTLATKKPAAFTCFPTNRFSTWTHPNCFILSPGHRHFQKWRCLVLDCLLVGLWLLAAGWRPAWTMASLIPLNCWIGQPLNPGPAAHPAGFDIGIQCAFVCSYPNSWKINSSGIHWSPSSTLFWLRSQVDCWEIGWYSSIQLICKSLYYVCLLVNFTSMSITHSPGQLRTSFGKCQHFLWFLCSSVFHHTVLKWRNHSLSSFSMVTFYGWKARLLFCFSSGRNFT